MRLVKYAIILEEREKCDLKSLVFYIYMNIFALLEFLKIITGIVLNIFPIFIAYLLVINVKFVAERVSLHCADTATLGLKGRNSVW